MDYSKYRDIAPYRGRDFDAAIRRLMEKREYLGAFVSVLVGGNDFSTIYNYLGTVVENISKVHDYPEFQKRITAGLLVPTVVERTMAVCGNLGLIGAPSFQTTSGYVVNLDTNENLGTVAQWVLDTFGVVIPAGYAVYMPSENIVWGAMTYAPEGMVTVWNWYLGPVAK